MSSLRSDLQIIADLVPEGVRLLDIGCGDGALLGWLAAHKTVAGRGIEIDAALVAQAMKQGVPVIQGDIERELVEFPDNAFDCVVLSQSLQVLRAPKQVLESLKRLAPMAIVSVPNFAHWKNRLHLGIKGKMPVTKTLSYAWYETPNIHFCTIADFVELSEALGFTIEKRLMVRMDARPSKFRGKGLWANLLGEQGIFVLKR